MRSLISVGTAVCLVALVVTTGLATKPGQDTNPNGFPSGPHFNLNIIGKKAQFTCPGIELDDEGNPIYGNVIFVPQNEEEAPLCAGEPCPIEIIMESGKGKKAAQVTELQVTDPCTEAFDGDAAFLRLPKNENGYHVYARALATPTDTPSMTIEPDLILVEDEAGNDLVYLGLVTSTGFATPSQTFTRAKGPSKAVNITEMFMWSGDVCYFSLDECLEYGDGICDPRPLCCEDIEPDGIWDSCEDKIVDPCPVGEDVTAYCNTFDEKWVFNIADLVWYLWSIDNDGLKLLQVRFYPVNDEG